MHGSECWDTYLSTTLIIPPLKGIFPRITLTTFPRPQISFKFRGEPKKTIRAASPGPRLTKAGSLRVVISVSWLGSRAIGSEPDVPKLVADAVEVARDPPEALLAVALAAPAVELVVEAVELVAPMVVDDECTSVTRLVVRLGT